MGTVDSFGDGIEELKRRRGDEDVTFADVADHLYDFATSSPQDAEVVGRLATFLARLDDMQHHHDATEGSTARHGTT
jgi:hypothetical protein